MVRWFMNRHITIVHYEQGRQTSQCHQCHGTGCFFALEISKPRFFGLKVSKPCFFCLVVPKSWSLDVTMSQNVGPRTEYKISSLKFLALKSQNLKVSKWHWLFLVLIGALVHYTTPHHSLEFEKSTIWDSLTDYGFGCLRIFPLLVHCAASIVQRNSDIHAIAGRYCS